MINMGNSDYFDKNTTGVVVQLLGDEAPAFSRTWNSLTDSQDSNISAGRYAFTEGEWHGDMGQYDHDEGGFDVTSVEWAAYFDHNEDSNYWAYTEGKPELE
ncbi:hypothetical protein ACFL2V_07855 [Pseudomonadota bacterium]